MSLLFAVDVVGFEVMIVVGVVVVRPVCANVERCVAPATDPMKRTVGVVSGAPVRDPERPSGVSMMATSMDDDVFERATDPMPMMWPWLFGAPAIDLVFDCVRVGAPVIDRIVSISLALDLRPCVAAWAVEQHSLPHHHRHHPHRCRSA